VHSSILPFTIPPFSLQEGEWKDPDVSPTHAGHRMPPHKINARVLLTRQQPRLLRHCGEWNTVEVKTDKSQAKVRVKRPPARKGERRDRSSVGSRPGHSQSRITLCNGLFTYGGSEHQFEVLRVSNCGLEFSNNLFTPSYCCLRPHLSS
jgi:hypothetical protein